MGVTPRASGAPGLLRGRRTIGFFRMLFPAILDKIFAHIPDKILGFSDGGNSLMMVHPLRPAL